jgi:hypothetical protein
VPTSLSIGAERIYIKNKVDRRFEKKSEKMVGKSREQNQRKLKHVRELSSMK